MEIYYMFAIIISVIVLLLLNIIDVFDAQNYGLKSSPKFAIYCMKAITFFIIRKT